MQTISRKTHSNVHKKNHVLSPLLSYGNYFKKEYTYNMYYACNGFGCFVDVRVKLTDKLTNDRACGHYTAKETENSP